MFAGHNENYFEYKIKQGDYDRALEQLIYLRQMALDPRIKDIEAVGTKVEEIKGADKLYKLTVDVGPGIGKRILCAGIKEYYSKEELKGKCIIVFINLG